MCSLEDTVVWIQVNFNNCKRSCTSPVKLYINSFATDVSIIVSVSYWVSLLNSTVITTNTFSQNLGLFQGTESILSLIHWTSFAGKIATSRGFVSFVFVSWKVPVLQPDSLVLLLESIWTGCWGLAVSVHCHPKVSKLCLTLNNRKLGGEGRRKREEREQGHTIHASLLGSKILFSTVT